MFSIELELISGMANPKGGNQAPSIRICGRLSFRIFSTSYDFFRGRPPPSTNEKNNDFCSRSAPQQMKQNVFFRGRPTQQMETNDLFRGRPTQQMKKNDLFRGRPTQQMKQMTSFKVGQPKK